MTKPWYERVKFRRVVTDAGKKTAKKPKKPGKMPLLMAAAPESDAQLGIGYNTFTGETRGFAVKESEKISTPSRHGQEVLYSIREIENRDQLRQHLGVSASASYSGIFSVSTKAEWSHDTTIENRYFYLLVSVNVKNSATLMKNYELTDGARALFAKSPYDWKTFYARYGDAFIHSISTGGEFHALYEFQTKSREEKDKLKISAKGSYGGFKASAEFQKNIETLVANTNVSADLFIRGGEGKLPDPIDPKKIVEASLLFPAAVQMEKGAPVSYQADFRDFRVTEGFPSGEDVPFYSETSDKNREVVAHLARLNDWSRDALRTAGDPLYGSEIKEEIARMQVQLGNKVRALAANPMTPHTVPAEMETMYANLKKQLIWRPVPGNLVRIAVGSHANVWGLDKEDKIVRWNESKAVWEAKDGRLHEISAGSEGQCIGVNRDGDVYSWNAPGNKWAGVQKMCYHLGVAKYFFTKFNAVSAGSNKQVWGLNRDGSICRQDQNGNWCIVAFARDNQIVFMDGFKQVSAGSDGTVWIRDKSDRVFNYRFEKLAADLIPGDMKHISVGDKNHIWGIDAKNNAVRWTGSGWDPVFGSLADVSVAGDGTVWGISRTGTVVRLEEEYIR